MGVTQTAEATRLPTPADVAFYREHGWWVSDQVVPHELLDRLGEVVLAHQCRPAARRLPAGVGHADWAPPDGGGIRNSEFVSLQEPAMRALSLLPAIGAIAARLADTASIRLFDDQAVVKLPGPSVVGWHTDHSYWSTCTSDRMLTAWIPFDDVTVDDGTLMVVDGSHRWPQSEHLRGFNDADLAGLGERLGVDVPEPTLVPIELRRGQVSFHHMRLVHGSGPNVAGGARMAMAVHLQDRENRHQPFTDHNGRLVVLPHDRLCRADATGAPDYTDAAVFPTVWEAGDG